MCTRCLPHRYKPKLGDCRRGRRQPWRPKGNASRPPISSRDSEIVFLCKEHLTILTQRVQQYGGTVQPAPTPETTHLVFNKAHDVAAAARDLDALPLPLDQAVSVQGHAIKLYKGVQYVAREFFSRSIGLGELQNEDDYRPDFYVTAKLMQVKPPPKKPPPLARRV